MAKPTLNDLLAQKADLEKQIAETQRAERADAISQVRTLMSQYGLTAADIGGKPIVPVRRATAKVAPKYRDPSTGSTWSGRGLKPNWLKTALDAGRTLADFAI